MKENRARLRPPAAAKERLDRHNPFYGSDLNSAAGRERNGTSFRSAILKLELDVDTGLGSNFLALFLQHGLSAFNRSVDRSSIPSINLSETLTSGEDTVCRRG